MADNKGSEPSSECQRLRLRQSREASSCVARRVRRFFLVTNLNSATFSADEGVRMGACVGAYSYTCTHACMHAPPEAVSE